MHGCGYGHSFWGNLSLHWVVEPNPVSNDPNGPGPVPGYLYCDHHFSHFLHGPWTCHHPTTPCATVID